MSDTMPTYEELNKAFEKIRFNSELPLRSPRKTPLFDPAMLAPLQGIVKSTETLSDDPS